MTQHTLSVCKFCHCSPKELAGHQLRDSFRLFEQLNTLSSEQASSSPLTIQPVDCMWACRHGCIIAISSPEKPTYLITDLPPDETAAPLLDLMSQYINHDTEKFPYKKLHDLFPSATLVQIPTVLLWSVSKRDRSPPQPTRSPCSQASKSAIAPHPASALYRQYSISESADAPMASIPVSANFFAIAATVMACIRQSWLRMRSRFSRKLNALYSNG